MVSVSLEGEKVIDGGVAVPEEGSGRWEGLWVGEDGAQTDADGGTLAFKLSLHRKLYH